MSTSLKNKNKLDATSYRLNMFWALLCPSSGAHNYNIDYNIGRFFLGFL